MRSYFQFLLARFAFYNCFASISLSWQLMVSFDPFLFYCFDFVFNWCWHNCLVYQYLFGFIICFCSPWYFFFASRCSELVTNLLLCRKSYLAHVDCTISETVYFTFRECAFKNYSVKVRYQCLSEVMNVNKLIHLYYKNMLIIACINIELFLGCMWHIYLFLMFRSVIISTAFSLSY